MISGVSMRLCVFLKLSFKVYFFWWLGRLSFRCEICYIFQEMHLGKPNDSLHANGEQALYRQYDSDVRPVVEREFASELSSAVFFRRILIRRRIERQIRVEVRKKMPSGADYFR